MTNIFYNGEYRLYHALSLAHKARTADGADREHRADDSASRLEQAPSRGLLVRNYLEGSQTPEEFLKDLSKYSNAPVDGARVRSFLLLDEDAVKEVAGPPECLQGLVRT